MIQRGFAPSLRVAGATPLFLRQAARSQPPASTNRSTSLKCLYLKLLDVSLTDPLHTRCQAAEVEIYKRKK